MLEMNQLALTDYIDMKEEIKKNISGIVHSFVEIGYYLKKIRDEELYKNDGYNDIWEMAKAEFKLERKQAWSFMNINDKYSVGGNSIELDEQWRGFNKSALTEMLSLPVEDYELITPDTKITDIRDLKEAEREQQNLLKSETEQVEGQMSLIKDMPDVVPESEKEQPAEITLGDVLRELFRPREMKEYLNNLVNMDPDSEYMELWVNDFNAQGNRTFKKIPYFIFFYTRPEGLKIKNIKTGGIKLYRYEELYFEVRAAFGQEVVKTTDVWTEAFGQEYEAEKQRELEEKKLQEEAERLRKENEKLKAEKKKQEEKRKKEIEKQREERQRQIKENQEKTVSEESEPEVVEGEVEEVIAVGDIAQDSTDENSDYENQEELLIEQYKEIESGLRRYFISKTYYFVGDCIEFLADNYKPIIGRITVKDSIYDSEFKVYGFEVLEDVQEEE